MKKVTLIFILTFGFITMTFAQSIESISGTVINSKNGRLFGNVMMISPDDSTLITGISFLEGKFELLNLNSQKVLLKLTSLEFQDTYISVEYEDTKNVDLGEILVLESQIFLEELVITSKSALVTENADGSIEVKVENTNLATSTSVVEILSKSPSIVYNADGDIEVFGKGAAIIFINGIRVTNERLSTLSPSNVEKIEIISNPGPRYDAEGNSVINIITKRNMDEGAKATIKNYYSYGEFAGYDNRTNIDYSYSKDRWIVNSNYGLLVGNERQIKTTTRTRNEADDFFNSESKIDWQNENNNFSNYDFGVQYNSSNDKYLSLQYTGAYEDLGGDQLNDNTIIDNETGIYNSTITQEDLTLKNTLSANYYVKTDSLGSNIFVGSQYSSYINNFDNDIEESNTIDEVKKNMLINNVGENNTKIFSAQVDYTKVFENGDMLEIGGKIGYVNINSNNTFFDITEDGMNINGEGSSNNFEYSEKVPAGYLNFKGSLTDNINYSAGLRSEWTDYSLITSVDGGKIIEDNYINVFPSASLSAKLSNSTTAYLTYSSRISRPSYIVLNPFVVYQDAFTSIQGNPNLQPAKVHAIELGSAFNGWSLKTGYNYTIDQTYGGAFQSEENSREYILRRANLSTQHVYFASLSKNISVKWWRSINTISTGYNDLIDDTNIFKIAANTPYYYLYSQNSFDIEDWITIYLTGWYQSDKQDGIYLRKNQSSINIGFEKKLFNNALQCNLDFNDVFHDIRADGEYKVGRTDIIYANTYSTNYVRFSMSYNFGELKKSNYKNKDVGKSETNRAQ